MKRTMYLTGHSPKRYIHKLQPLALLRISDMRELKRELIAQANALPEREGKYREIVKRHEEVETAIEWWTALLNEGETDVETITQK